MADFADVRLEDGIVSLNMQGGNSFSTTVVTVNGGFEQRNQNWTKARGKWQVGQRTVDEIEFQDFKAFFMSRRGKKQAFRLKDWTDYKDNGWGILGLTGLITDYTVGTYQMYKRYPSGSDFYLDKKTKPVAGSVEIKVNGISWPIGSGEGQASINYLTGIVTINPYLRSVTNATNAANCEITTSAAHGLTTGQYVKLESINGLTQLNNNWYQVTVVSTTKFTIGLDTRTAYITAISKAAQAVIATSNPHGYNIGEDVVFSNIAGMTEINGLTGTVVAAGTNTFTVNINSTAFSTYTSSGTAIKTTQTQTYGLFTSGGQARRFLQNGDAITWTGEFDVPVRFDTDDFDATLEAVVHPTPAISRDSQSYMKLGNFPVVEIRE